MRFIGFLMAIIGGTGSGIAVAMNYYAGNETWVAIMVGCIICNLMLGIWWATNK